MCVMRHSGITFITELCEALWSEFITDGTSLACSDLDSAKQIEPAKVSIQKQPEHGIQNALPFHLHFPSQWWMSAIQSTIFRLNEVIGSSEKSEQRLICTAKRGPISRCYYNFRPVHAPLHEQLDSGINLCAPFIKLDTNRLN